MKKLISMLMTLPAVSFAGGPGKPGMGETEMAYGVVVLFLAIIFGVDAGAKYLSTQFKNYMKRKKEEQLLSHE